MHYLQNWILVGYVVSTGTHKVIIITLNVTSLNTYSLGHVSCAKVKYQLLFIVAYENALYGYGAKNSINVLIQLYLTYLKELSN